MPIVTDSDKEKLKRTGSALYIKELILYNMYIMKIITTTEARKHIAEIINRVRHEGEVIAIGRRHSIDALIIQFPTAYNKDRNDITNINTHSRSFDFLSKEPDIYSVSDLKKKYA